MFPSSRLVRFSLLAATRHGSARRSTRPSAQLQSGNVHGTVRSDEGDLLPGVTVELSGLGAPLTRITDGQGQFRFLGLAPGSYRLAATLKGFSMAVVHETVTVRVGRNTASR